MSVMDSIYNYNERLVLDEIARQTKEKSFSDEELSDIACVALNKVPAKYIKYGVDRAFYADDEETISIEKQIKESVTEAIKFISSAPH